MQPVSYQVPDNDAYAMARQQNYPMDELGNYYAPNGQVISPGTTMADLTSASTQTPVSPGGFAPTPNWTAQSGEMFVPDKQYYPLVGGQQFDSPAQAYMAEKEAERRQIGDGIDGVDSPEVELSKVIAVDSELPEVPKTQAELDALKAKNIADGGTEVGAIVEVDDSKDTINAQLTKETDNAVANRNVNGLATLLASDKFTPEQKDIIKENIKIITKSSVTEQRDKVLLEKTLAGAATGDKKAKKVIANALEGKAPRGETKEEGSFFLGLFYSAIGQKALAAEQFRKAQGGTTVVALTDSDGNFAGRAKKGSDGSLVAGSAVGIDGNVMSETQVAGLQYLKSDVNRINKVGKASMVYMPGTGKKGDVNYVEAAGYQVTLNPNGTIKKVLDSTGTQVTDPTLAKNIITQYAKNPVTGAKAKTSVTAEPYIGSDKKIYKSQSTTSADGVTTTYKMMAIDGSGAAPEGVTFTRLRDDAAITKLNLNMINQLKVKHAGNVMDALAEFRKNSPVTLTPKMEQDFLEQYKSVDITKFIPNGGTGTSTGPVSPAESKTKVISDMEGGAAPVKLQTENLTIKKVDKPGRTTIVESETITAPSKTTVGIETSSW